MLLRVNQAQPQRLVGLELQADGIAVAVKAVKNQLPHIERLAFLPGENDKQRFAQLRDYVKQNKLKNKPCNLVLPQNRYQLYLLEAPDVPAAELANAMKWRLKDLVNQPLDQLAVDVFHVPNDGARGNRKMIYVVVVNKSYLQELIEYVQQSELKLLAIDIAELADTDSTGPPIINLNGQAQAFDPEIAAIAVGGGNRVAGIADQLAGSRGINHIKTPRKPGQRSRIVVNQVKRR